MLKESSSLLVVIKLSSPEAPPPHSSFTAEAPGQQGAHTSYFMLPLGAGFCLFYLRYIYICALTLNITKIMQFSFLLHFSHIKNYACIIDMHIHAYTYDIHTLTDTLGPHSSTPLATLSYEKQAPTLPPPGRRPCVSETFRALPASPLCPWVGSCMNPIST